jgi:methionyl-tRNA formyltransferase
VALVVTEPDRRRGRGSGLQPTPVKALADSLGLPVTHDLAEVAGAGVELGVVVAFGRIIPAAMLDLVPMVNVHFSLLPRWRGAAPVERAILAGDEMTGVCLMQVEAGLDTGGVYACRRTPIDPDESAGELTGRLAALGAALLVEQLAAGVAGLGAPVAQEGEVTYASKLRAADRHLDLARPAVELHRVIRVGRAFTEWRAGRLIIHRAGFQPFGDSERAVPPPVGSIAGERIATGDGWLVPVEVQGEGRGRQSFAEWTNGARPAAGERLGVEVAPAHAEAPSSGSTLA